jgi:hypothetical protein
VSEKGHWQNINVDFVLQSFLRNLMKYANI